MKNLSIILVLMFLFSCSDNSEVEQLNRQLSELQKKYYELELRQRNYQNYTQPVITGVVNEISFKIGVQYPPTFEEWIQLQKKRHQIK